MEITYRPAGPEDMEFLYRLHESAMRAAVEAAYGPWEEAWQRDYFCKHFDPAVLQVIRVDGADAGMLRVQERTEECFLMDIEILPEFQRRGVGTQTIRGLIERAQAQGKPVALQVLKGNIAARSLYQRLGFGVTGENETHYTMACEPRRF